MKTMAILEHDRQLNSLLFGHQLWRSHNIHQKCSCHRFERLCVSYIKTCVSNMSQQQGSWPIQTCVSCWVKQPHWGPGHFWVKSTTGCRISCRFQICLHFLSRTNNSRVIREKSSWYVGNSEMVIVGNCFLKIWLLAVTHIYLCTIETP